ncbi:hypothetical protein ACXPWS_19225 [Mycobacterium sp. BMJ-28]
MQIHSAAARAVQTTAAHRGDVRQAEYYVDLLDELRATVAEDLAHQRASLARRELDGVAFGVSRLQRAIKIKEAELATLTRLAEALSSRFPSV